MQQNEQNGALVPFTVYQAQAIQELDAEYSMWAENVDRHTDEIQRLRDDFEKMRNGYMTLLTKLERQEGIIAQLQLELQSYRIAAHKSNFAEKSGNGKAENQPEISASISGSAQANKVPRKQKRKSENTRQNFRKLSADVKYQVIAKHHLDYPEQTQEEVAKFFGITDKTIRNWYVMHGEIW